MPKDSLVIKNKKGFSLVEAIVATAIFAIITTSIVASYFKVSNYILAAAVERQAIFMAEEGQEAVRNIRDNDFAKLVVGGSSYGLSSSGNVWGFSGTQDTNGIYTRKINIATTADANTLRISSLINWAYKGVSKSFTLTREYSNWRKTKAVASVSRWPFDDNAGCTTNDAKGSNNGTLKPATCPTGSPTWSTGTKRVGTSALTFNGTTAYVQVGDNNTLDLSTAGTLMAWVYPTKNATMGIIHKGTASNGSDEAYFLRMDSGRKVTGGGRNAANTQVTVQSVSNLLPLNTWTHVAFTWDATGMKIYINGIADYPANTTVLNARNSSGALQIGSLYPSGSNNNFFQGTIDEVSVYNVALTQAQISAIYASQ